MVNLSCDTMGDNYIVRSSLPQPELPETDLYSFVIRDWANALDEVALVGKVLLKRYLLLLFYISKV